MKATITRFTIDNNLKTTGDDIIFIHIFFKVDDKPEIRMPLILSYYDLVDFISEADKATGKYLDNIRSSMHGYGPKHSKIFKVMEEEGFDIEPFIYKYFESKDTTYILQHVEWCEKAQTPENNKTAKESLKKLDVLVNDDYRNYNIKFDAYKDALDQSIHETTLTYFPELFEMSKKHIAAYRNELVNTTLSFSSEIDKIVHSKFKEYWEKRYNENNKAE